MTTLMSGLQMMRIMVRLLPCELNFINLEDAPVCHDDTNIWPTGLGDCGKTFCHISSFKLQFLQMLRCVRMIPIFSLKDMRILVRFLILLSSHFNYILQTP